MKNIDQAKFQKYVEWPLILVEILYWWLQIKLELDPKVNHFDNIEDICTSVFSLLSKNCSFTLFHRQQIIAKSEI